ncbi:MAG TPA: hypothetical protein DIC42_05045 [Holosporales bacterium]|nr:hypothetical protein [Holosporales bacterium]
MQKNVLLFLLLNAVAIAKNVPPLTVTADEMTYNDKTKISTAVGNAIATFHNAEEGTQILTADSMTAHHNADDINGVDTLQATSTQHNHVLFQSPTLTVTATTCRYDGKAQNIICTGCVKVTDLKKKDTVTGDKAEINIQTKVYGVESFGEHISEAILHTGSAAPKT